MRVASIRVVQHRLAEVLSWVEAGEEVAITRRDKIVARLVPPAPWKMPDIDFAGRLRTLYARELSADESISRLLLEDRDERF